MNMGGTALYQGLATLFMAQIFRMDLALSALVAIVATALGAFIATKGFIHSSHSGIKPANFFKALSFFRSELGM